MMFVSGRIEFLGKHTDYCGGRSLVCAIDRGFRVSVTPNDSKVFSFVDAVTGETASISSIDGAVIQSQRWAHYPQTVVRRVLKNFSGRTFVGGEIRFESTLPAAAGVSSSSALIIAVFAGIAKLNNLQSDAKYRDVITEEESLAEYLGCIENGLSYKTFDGENGVGTFGGSQDHAAIICGRRGKLTSVSFCPVRIAAQLDLPSGYRFVVASSGVTAEKTGGAMEKYNNLSLMTKEIAGKLDPRKSLAELVYENGFEQIDRQLTEEPLKRRLLHFYEESFLIIPEVCESLLQGDIPKTGILIDRSHRNADELLGNQTPETNFLQSSARDKGAMAASAFGAGFGGSVYALVKNETADDFLSNWRDAYLRKFPQFASKCAFFTTGAGQSELSLSASF